MSGLHHTEESKEKIRNSEYHRNQGGANNSFFGKTHSRETIQKIVNSEGYKNRKTRKGMLHSEETKEKMRKKRIKPSKLWHNKYRHDLKVKGLDRNKILEWCRLNKCNDLNGLAQLWNAPCQECRWNKAKCDIHHKIPKAIGGTSDLTNLVILCPNCHRLEHLRWNKENKEECRVMHTSTTRRKII